MGQAPPPHVRRTSLRNPHTGQVAARLLSAGLPEQPFRSVIATYSQIGDAAMEVNRHRSV